MILIFLKKCNNNNINNDLFLFGLPGVMIIVKLWVHTSVKWKLSWGWESHCVVSISRDPNSSSNLSKVLRTQPRRPKHQREVPNLSNKSTLVCQNLPLWPPAISDGKTYKSSLTVFLNKHQSRHQPKKNTLIVLLLFFSRENDTTDPKKNHIFLWNCAYLDIFGGSFQIYV